MGKVCLPLEEHPWNSAVLTRYTYPARSTQEKAFAFAAFNTQSHVRTRWDVILCPGKEQERVCSSNLIHNSRKTGEYSCSLDRSPRQPKVTQFT